MNTLERFENEWGIHKDDPHSFPNINDIYFTACRNVKVGDKMCMSAITERFQDYFNKLIECHNELDTSDFETKVRITRLLEILYYSKNMVIANKRINECSDLSNDFRGNYDCSLFRFRAIESDDNTPYQNLILYVLNYMYENGYKRYSGNVYKPITTEEGFDTKAWEHVDSIINVVYGCAQKEINYDQFKNFTARSDSCRAITDFLTNCKDSQFNEIKKDRHIFSFKNGVYFASNNTFMKYENGIPDGVVSSKYFDIEFDSYDSSNWKDIDTPLFDSILDYQNIKDDIKYWIYAFIGRLIYDVNEKDGWQVIFFFQGQAGTGKSTIVNVCKSFYGDEDVGTISNNIQRKFGLSDILGKMMFVAPEIKRDFTLEQAEFQSMVSGDAMTIAIKCKESQFVNSWSIPGILAGNETPDFIDNFGSIQRRIVSVRFTKRVMDGDMMLGKKLHEETARILHKCNMAYIDAYTKYAKDNIWKHLPKYFNDNRNAMAAATNPLIHFLSSDQIRVAPGSVIPEKEFITLFNHHCMENNYTKPRFNSDFFTGPFTQFGISIKTGEHTWPPEGLAGSKRRNGKYFSGVDIKHEIDSPQDTF